jgi:hypothetical protein
MSTPRVTRSFTMRPQPRAATPSHTYVVALLTITATLIAIYDLSLLAFGLY